MTAGYDVAVAESSNDDDVRRLGMRPTQRTPGDARARREDSHATDESADSGTD